MHLSDFDYSLPEELIAKYPLAERTASRMLCLSRDTSEIQHRYFTDLLDYVNPGDLLVFNNTRVIPARLFTKKATGGQCEVLVERIVDEFHALCHVRASKTLKPSTPLYITSDIFITVESRQNNLFLLRSSHSFITLLNQHGEMPLPPYLDRAAQESDKERYQTVYGNIAGAVAAPTAGLHFDEVLLEKLKQKGVDFAYVTLHVGAGTFQPVRVENILEHVMHYEYAQVSLEVCEKIKQTQFNGNKVIAVGTTSARSLETAAMKGDLQPFSGETNLFIYPGFQFRVIDALLTNFHLPKSTLLMLICAFAGQEPVLAAYQQAIQNHYRFFSYGDAMLIY